MQGLWQRWSKTV